MGMNIILFDGEEHKSLLPITYTRPVSYIRIGISTILEKWQRYFPEVSVLSEPYLQNKFPFAFSNEACVFVNAGLCPNSTLINAIQSLQPGQKIISKNVLLAANTHKSFNIQDFHLLEPIEYSGDFLLIQYPWDIFRNNGEALIDDFKYLTLNRKSEPLPTHCTLIGNPELLFIAPGATVLASIINTSGGPVYIGNNAEVMEGCMLRGPIAICDHAGLKMAAKIYGPTTIGPYCRVGGEVNNSVFFAYSNKGHDGFVGNSVIAEWCNLGADTNTSNLKNNYGNVKIWSYPQGKMAETSLQFCGTIMADHAKTGINTMLNTATVVGVAANIFGGGFPPKFIPDFSWGGSDGFESFDLQKCFEVAERMMQRRNVTLTDNDKDILTKVAKETAIYRNF